MWKEKVKEKEEREAGKKRTKTKEASVFFQFCRSSGSFVVSAVVPLPGSRQRAAPQQQHLASMPLVRCPSNQRPLRTTRYKNGKNGVFRVYSSTLMASCEKEHNTEGMPYKRALSVNGIAFPGCFWLT